MKCLNLKSKLISTVVSTSGNRISSCLLFDSSRSLSYYHDKKIFKYDSHSYWSSSMFNLHHNCLVNNTRWKNTMRNLIVEKEPLNMDHQHHHQLPPISVLSSQQQKIKLDINDEADLQQQTLWNGLLSEYPFLSLVSLIFSDQNNELTIDMRNDPKKISQKFFKQLSEKCADNNFMSQVNELINEHDELNHLLVKLRLLCGYNPNFLNLFYEQHDNLSMYLKEFKTHETLGVLENIFAHHFRSYNQNLNGLIAIIMMNVVLNSKNCFKHWFNTVDNVDAEKPSISVDNSLKNLANCFDLISYGIKLHDNVALKEKYQVAANLQLLIGDYCLIKGLSISATYSNIDIHNCLFTIQSLWVEHETSCFDDNYHDKIYNAALINEDMNDGHQYQLEKIINDFRFKYLSSNNLFEPSSIWLDSALKKCDQNNNSMLMMVEPFLIYCYLTGGFQTAQILRTTFKYYQLNEHAQKFMFELGQNLGIAIKIYNDLINQSNHYDSKIFGHVNEKYPAVSKNIKRHLIKHYLEESERLLKTELSQYIIGGDDKQNKLNDRSLILLDLFMRMLNQMKRE